MALLTTLGKGQGFLKGGFLGFQGSGKTYTAMSLAIGLRKYLHLDGPIAFFDTEGGSEYVAERVRKETGKDLLGVKSQSFQDLLDMAAECVPAKVSVLLADSMTHVWRELCDSYLDHVNEMLRKKNMGSRKKLEFQDWGPIKRKWADWTQFYLNAPLHIIICGRAGFEYEMEKDEETGRKELIKTGVKMKTETEFGFEPSLLVEMERLQVSDREGGFTMVHHATVLKDRFGVMDAAEFDNPSFDFFLPHIARLTPGANVPINVTSKTPMQVDEAGADDFHRRKQRQQKAWEEVDNGLAIIYPSSVGKDKQAKLTILQGLTGSASELKIQTLPPEQLELMALAIRKFGQDILEGLIIEKPALYVRMIYEELQGVTEGKAAGDGLENQQPGIATDNRAARNTNAIFPASQDAPPPHDPDHTTADAEIEQNDLRQEYVKRFQAVYGPAANPIYKEMQADARLTQASKDSLYKTYVAAMKTQKVK